MSLEKASISWSARQVKNMVMNEMINFNHIVQRSYVWERARKTALIESMIVGYPVPPVFAKRIKSDGSKNDKVYYIMDGKQRLSTVKEYLNDEFTLTDIAPVSYFDDEANEEHTKDISGLKFSELPETLQNNLSSMNFSVIYFDNLSKEEERELFKRLNAGKPLSSKSKMLASCTNIEELLEIGDHPLFDDMLSEKSKDNKNQISILMKIWCMMNQDIENLSFESRVFNPLIEEAEITEEQKAAMNELFDFIVDIHTMLMENKQKRVARKLYTETHMVSLVPYFSMAIKNNVDKKSVVDWLEEFFGVKETATISESYNAACAAGSAKNINIVARHNALKESYEQFV